MQTAVFRYYGLGLLLLGAIGVLVTAWLLLTHAMFAVVAVVVITLVLLSLLLWDGLRQSSPEVLAARGVFPDSEHGARVIDRGLRREWDAPLIPYAVRGRTPGHRTTVPVHRAPPQPRPQAPRAPRAAQATQANATAKSARSGPIRRKNGALQPDATISLAVERRAAGIDDLFAALDAELIGLVPVKKKVEQIGSLLLVDRARQRFGLSSSRPNLHMCFTGAPGTGKTTVALMMADLLHRLGYLEKNHVVHAMRDDLVGEYIGQTAPKTKAVLDRAMGGVLFIDEAYSLYRAQDSKDYGQECIDVLMQVMENERDRLVVILAGYKDRMDHFFESNPA